MKLTVEFPSVSYREGPQGVMHLARAIEQIGYDHIDMFDHVVMGYPMEGRPPGPYPAQMPILEALMVLSYMAAVTTRIRPDCRRANGPRRLSRPDCRPDDEGHETGAQPT